MGNFSKDQSKLFDKIKQSLTEATSTIGSSGRYTIPLSPGLRLFKKNQLGPFIIPTSNFDDAKLAYDSYDGELDVDPAEIDGIEHHAEKVSEYIKNHPAQNDEDGDILNQGGTNEDHLNEDLAVWFGKKKKPKGSKQPKGPWVNICKKVDGKHPPCGRPDADSKGYPKCRAAGVAGKMSDSEKKAACSQKRREEKKHPKSGTGNKPTMTSYKPKNESQMRDLIKKIISETIKN